MKSPNNILNFKVGTKFNPNSFQIFVYFILPILIGLLTNCNSPQNTSENVIADRIKQDGDQVPAIQVLVPGFSVKELPLELTNINVVRYGADGRLYALAYDGHIYVLSDTDGDGIEDKAEYWWDKETIISPVGMVISAEGIYVTSLNKVSLIKDLNEDGIGDTEEIILSDWKKPSVYTGTTTSGVDAFGIAQDDEGDLFFALGSADFTKAYMVDSLGNSHYDLNSYRGTVLKLPQGKKEPEIFVTGTRFPVAMAFNDQGDLFATDQEGATWLPNGNPYDELLHIQQGRHYGFPPRHPKYLPDVIDEPSVFDYKPQHQSTTGLNFNFPVNKGPVFGPQWWEGDAIVTAYSRGKIYRTKLVKTSSGYVANNSIIASLPALTVDACVSPSGDLVVATHSGPPDWGLGPNGAGKLYKIIYSDSELPNPVAVWASKPDQVKIAFDRPLKKDYLTDLPDKITMEYGKYVEAGDRFELVRPGYKAVERQMNFPRKLQKVKSAFLSDDSKTLVLNTYIHTDPETYAVTLPAFYSDKKVENSLDQVSAIDISYTLNGVGVYWQANSGQGEWEGVIPHIDLNVSKAFNHPISETIELGKNLKKDGKVTFKTQLNLWNLLRADIQPESTLDFRSPPENITLYFKSSQPLDIKCEAAKTSGSVKKDNLYETKLSISDLEEKAYYLEVSMNTTGDSPLLEIHYSTDEDSRLRALQIHRFFLPWVEEIFSKGKSPVQEIPQLAGGNWSRGKELFFGEATCSNCHSIMVEGKSIGPDLANLIFRDYNSVWRDISEPSATINPDFLAHNITLKNKEKLVGMISYKKDSIVIRDITDNATAINLKEVDGISQLSVSLMPPGLDKMLGEQKMKDLMTYLLTSMQPAEIEYPFLPPMKNKSEVNAVLGRIPRNHEGEKDYEPMKILWVSGPKDHGPDEHDYPLQQERWSKLLSLEDKVTVTNVTHWPSADQFKESDVIVFYWNFPDFNEDHGKQLDAYLQKGGGLVYLHFAVDATANPKALADRIGLAWQGGVSKFRHGDVELKITQNAHPITQGFNRVLFHDETYWQLVKGAKNINVLATAKEEGEEIPILWTTTEGKGRVFVSILGHYNWTFDDPLFRILLLRGISWTGNQSNQRFEDIATIGARVSK